MILAMERGLGGRSRMGAGNTRRHKWGNRSVGGLRLHEGYPRGTGKLNKFNFM